MAKDTGMDMTMGNPVKQIVRFGFPIALSNVFQCLYNMCDGIIVGRFVGSEALASVGATSTLLHFILLLSIALPNGMGVAMSQHYGAKREDLLKKTVVCCLYLVVILSAVTGAAGIILARPIMRLMQTEGNVLEGAVIYVQICVGGCIGQLLYNTCTSVLRAVGDSKTPLIFLIVSSVINIGLNLFFVLSFDWGVAGVAIATVIAQVLSSIACVVYMLKKYPMFRISGKDLKPDLQVFRQALSYGASLSLKSTIPTAADVAVSACINSFGAVTIAAYTCAYQVGRYAVIFFNSLGYAFTTFSAQNSGAGKPERIEDCVRKALLINLVMAAFWGCFMFFFGEYFIKLYLSADEANFVAVVSQAKTCLRLNCILYLIYGLLWIYGQVLIGTGDKITPVVSSIFEVISKLGCTFLLTLAIGVTGIWVASPIGWVLGTIPQIIVYYRGRWKKRVLDNCAVIKT